MSIFSDQAVAAQPGEQNPNAVQAFSAGSGNPDYWTKARMRAATPAPSPAAPRFTFYDKVVRPWAETAAQAKRWTGGGAVVKTVGRVFFSTPNADHACTASVVNSTGHDLLVTAGHCVYPDASQQVSNWVFVPGYDDGDAPLGKWSATQLIPTAGWRQNQNNLNEDVGFVHLAPLNGRRIQDVVGANSIAFNTPVGQSVQSFGYPAQRTFNGERLYYCQDTTRPDSAHQGSTDIGIGCDMNGGSSGGPWLTGVTASSGTVISVNSFGYDDMPNVMWGPLFDDSIKATYAAAQTL